MSRLRQPGVRIIPRLDIKGPNVVKGVHLEGLRVLGRPEQFARAYYHEGADELLYVDVVASLYGRQHLLDILSRTSRELFIPLTVAGGLRTLEDIRMVLQAGADKVALNTAAIRRPGFVREAVQRFGSSTIVVSIEAILQPSGRYEAYTDHGREPTGIDAVEWATRVSQLGAGEILVTSIDREGTGQGFDLELTRQIAEAVPIPVIACGGAGRLEHIAEVVTQGAADAVCVASILHYNVLKRFEIVQDVLTEGNLEYLKTRRPVSRICGASLAQIRASLVARGVPCRQAALEPVERPRHVVSG